MLIKPFLETLNLLLSSLGGCLIKQKLFQHVGKVLKNLNSLQKLSWEKYFLKSLINSFSLDFRQVFLVWVKLVIRESFFTIPWNISKNVMNGASIDDGVFFGNNLRLKVFNYFQKKLHQRLDLHNIFCTITCSITSMQ